MSGSVPFGIENRKVEKQAWKAAERSNTAVLSAFEQSQVVKAG